MVPPSSSRRRLRRLQALLWLLWALVSFVLPYFAREGSLTLLGWPVFFWMAAQGSVLVFLLITIVHAHAANRADAEDPPPGPRGTD